MNILADYKQYLMFKFCTLTTTINNRELKYDIETNEIWCANKRSGKWTVRKISNHVEYLKIRIGNKVYLHHRVIYKFYNPEWNIEDGSTDNSIDHKNGKTTDNHIANLRNVTHQQNHWNYTKAIGICWVESLKKWKAQICVNRKKINLGYFDLKEDARNAYLEAKKIYHNITPIPTRKHELQEQKSQL